MTSVSGFGQDITKILSSKYEHKMISSGRNFPTVNIQADNLGDVCVLLHHRVPAEKIRAHFGWAEEKLQSKLDVLLRQNLIKKDEKSGYLPTLMVISLEDGKKLTAGDKSLVGKTSRMLARRLPEIKRLYAQIEGFRGIDFDDASLFILSDVLLDNWQINNVERQFLKAERTLRNGTRYYYSIQQKEAGRATEAFGIYGNQFRGYGSVSVGLYGNRRQQPNLINLTAPQLKEWFGMEAGEAETLKRNLLTEILSLSKNPQYELNAGQRTGFEKLGWLRNGKLIVPVLNVEDERKLSGLANAVADELVRSLDSHRDNLQQKYKNSACAREISFEEFCIWWYHFFYSEVTDDLAAKDYVKIPDAGNFTYFIEQ